MKFLLLLILAAILGGVVGVLAVLVGYVAWWLLVLLFVN